TMGYFFIKFAGDRRIKEAVKTHDNREADRLLSQAKDYQDNQHKLPHWLRKMIGSPVLDYESYVNQAFLSNNADFLRLLYHRYSLDLGEVTIKKTSIEHALYQGYVPVIDHLI